MTIELEARDERMLELLAEGLDTRAIAKQMGYEPGTMRVYLHKLYKKLGVGSRGEAAAWHHRREQAADSSLSLLIAAEHALRSYQHGNTAPDLAEEVADKIDAYIKATRTSGASHAETGHVHRR